MAITNMDSSLREEEPPAFTPDYSWFHNGLESSL